MKIGTPFGDLDLVEYRSRIAGVSDEDCEAEAVLDALEAALSVSSPPTPDNIVRAPYDHGYIVAIRDVRKAAGVVEEPT